MKYGKKIALALLSLCIILGVTGCVSPFYGTARIEKGFHMDAGLAATSFLQPGDPPSYCVGGRVDCEARYGFNEYLGLNGRAGLCYGKEVPFDSSGFGAAGNVAIGVQGALPLKFITPALRIELTHYTYPTIAPTLLLGIGQREFITLGARASIESIIMFDGIDVFLTVHPTSNWSVFGGVHFTSYQEEPLAAIGVGYKLK
ncbi:hypothetical protein GX441_06425 [bacterium]|nr:hypothetical protein [bacterium]